MYIYIYMLFSVCINMIHLLFSPLISSHLVWHSLSHQQVSLARSPPLKNEDSTCEGLLLMSYDRTLVVKEICSEEVEEMHNILSEYHQVGQSGCRIQNE